MAEISVYIDGRCALCVASARRLRRLDVARKIGFVDINDPQAQTGLPERLRQQDFGPKSRREGAQTGLANRAMIVGLRDGTFRVGYFACVEVARNIPVLTPLAKGLLSPLFYGIGPRIYAFVAKHRLEISKLLRLPPPCSDDGTCRIDNNREMIATL